jgi:hypothetical protein
MNKGDPADVGRRDFIAGVAGVATTAATGVAFAAQPCPPSTLSVEGGTTASTTCEQAQPGQLPALTLTSGAPSGVYAWTFGHAFKKGDVPSGSSLTTNAQSSQAWIRNRWSDGSAKFAVISGISSFTQGTQHRIQLATGSGSGGGNVPEPGNLDASVTFSGAVSGTYSVQAALGVNKASWNGRTTAGRVRQFLGPVMSEFHYYVPTSDAHITVWFYVRCYSNGAINVETVVENGWARVPSPVEKSYTIAVRVGGSQRYSATIAHRHHARWSRQDWIGTDPQIIPRHDSAYLKSTKLVPNYAQFTVSSTTLNELVQSAAPMTRGDFDEAGRSGGYHAHLGLLPVWDAAYVVSGDPRAYRSMLANEQASNCCRLGPGQAGFNTRDESTGLPMNLVDFYDESYSNGYSPDYGSGKVYRGSDSSSAPWSTDPAHGWAAGYLAYLVTGRWFSLETTQFGVGADFMAWGTNSSNDGQRWLSEERFAAWSMRLKACALAITPDSGAGTDALRAGYVRHLEECWQRWRTSEVGHNNLGIRRNIYNFSAYAPAPYLSCGAFQQNFVVQAFGFAYDIAAELVNATARQQWLESVRFHGLFPVGLLGMRPNGYCYRRAGLYGLAVGPNRDTARTTFYSSWAEVYNVAVQTGAIPSGESCETGSTLLGGYFPNSSSYWGNLYPAAAYAKDFGVTGADAAWARMVGASNHSQFVQTFPEFPQFAIVPR